MIGLKPIIGAGMGEQMGDGMIITICDNCGVEFDVDEANTCPICGATLCPECVCEGCENAS